MGATQRAAKMADRIKVIVAEMLERRIKDPRLGFITVTGAKMSPDLREVTVFVSVHGEEPVRAKTMEGLKAATSYIQREAARNLRLRVVPHMRLTWDGSIEEGDKIERLLKEAKEKDGR